MTVYIFYYVCIRERGVLGCMGLNGTLEGVHVGYG